MKVRIIAGPNGSGKSTLIFSLEKELKVNMGFIINVDDIEKHLKQKKCYLFDKAISINTAQLQHFIKTSTINKKYNLKNQSSLLLVEKNKIILTDNSFVNSYLCAAIADFLRIECLNQKINFINKTFFPQWAEPFKI